MVHPGTTFEIFSLSSVSPPRPWFFISMFDLGPPSVIFRAARSVFFRLKPNPEEQMGLSRTNERRSTDPPPWLSPHPQGGELDDSWSLS